MNRKRFSRVEVGQKFKHPDYKIGVIFTRIEKVFPKSSFFRWNAKYSRTRTKGRPIHVGLPRVCYIHGNTMVEVKQ